MTAGSVRSTGKRSCRRRGRPCPPIRRTNASGSRPAAAATRCGGGGPAARSGPAPPPPAPKENRSVALKILHSEVAQDGVAVERFKREFQCSSSLPHDYIVEVLAFERTEDQSFALVMEYLEGEELRTLLKRDKVMSPERVIRMMAHVAIGLSAAHERKVVHRDLKPDNIFLCGSREGDLCK